MITTAHAQLLLSLMQLGRSALEQFRLAELDEISPELRAELEDAAKLARSAWDALAPEQD